MNSRNKLRLLSVAVAMTMASMSVPMASAGGLQNKMDAVFNDMSNVSRPGVFETQRRGVLSGGSAYVRSPIMNTELSTCKRRHSRLVVVVLTFSAVPSPLSTPTNSFSCSVQLRRMPRGTLSRLRWTLLVLTVWPGSITFSRRSKNSMNSSAILVSWHRGW